MPPSPPPPLRPPPWWSLESPGFQALPLPLPLRPCRSILTHTACFFSFWASAAAAAAAAAAFAVKCRCKRTRCSPPLHLSCSSAHTCLSPGGACTPNGASTLGLPTGLLTGAGRDVMLAAMAASLAATACCTSGG